MSSMPDEPHHEHGHHDDDDEHRHGPRGLLQRLLEPFVGHSHDPGASIDAALTIDARGIRAVKLSLVILGVTALGQLAVVMVSGSVALLADTVHNFSDALTAVPLWIAFALGSRAATRRYTFGYRRAEDLAGLFILLMIVASAGIAAFESISRLVEPRPMTNIPIVIVAGLVGFVGNEAVALFRIRVGRQIGSAALVADGYHARTDGLTSLAVVAGAAGVAAGFPLADPIVGLFITVAILFVLRQAAGQVFGRLMDAVEPEIVDDVEAIAASVPEVQSVDGLRVRWLGHGLEASMAITVDADMSVADGHRISETVRHRLLHDVPRLDVASIHVNPCRHTGIDPHESTHHHETRARPETIADRAAGR